MHDRSNTDTRTARPLRRLASRPVAALLAALIALTPLAAPAPALARKAASDAVAGVPLAARKVPVALAPDVDTAAGILMNGDGRILWARNSHQRRPMASTTKVMTGLLAVERGQLDRVVTVSRAAAGVPYASGLRAGQRVTVRQLLQLALVASSNDAAYALGESVSGNMPAFVNRMNARARELGLRDTRYANPHGLDAPGHFSSAADLAALTNTAMRLPDFARTVSLRQAALPGGPALASTDQLLGRYPGLLGGKTGYTGGAGFSFVGSAQRGGTRLTAVVLGTPSNPARFAEAAKLLDWGFSHLVRQTLAKGSESAGALPLSADPARKVPIRLAGGVRTAVLHGAPIVRTTSVPQRLGLPVFAGQPVGQVTFTQGGTVLGRSPIVAAESTASIQETVGAVPVSDYLDLTVPASASDKAEISRFDTTKPVTRRVQLAPEVEAPVAQGQQLGEILYSQGDRVVARVPVVAARSVDTPDLLRVLAISINRGWRSVFGGRTVAELQLFGPASSRGR